MREGSNTMAYELLSPNDSTATAGTVGQGRRRLLSSLNAIRFGSPAMQRLIIAATLCVALAACGGGGGEGRAPEPGDRAVAKVQDQTIWASDVRREAVAQGLVGEGEPLDVTSGLFRRVLQHGTQVFQIQQQPALVIGNLEHGGQHTGLGVVQIEHA